MKNKNYIQQNYQNAVLLSSLNQADNTFILTDVHNWKHGQIHNRREPAAHPRYGPLPPALRSCEVWRLATPYDGSIWVSICITIDQVFCSCKMQISALHVIRCKK